MAPAMAIFFLPPLRSMLGTDFVLFSLRWGPRQKWSQLAPPSGPFTSIMGETIHLLDTLFLEEHALWRPHSNLTDGRLD